MYALNLDTVSWKELYESACRRMAQLVPGWSDEIPSDPAVVLLELTSYLSAVQNREINRLQERHYLAYLKLLGKSPRAPAPARLMAASLAASAFRMADCFSPSATKIWDCLVPSA